jgi:hypothetical protein
MRHPIVLSHQHRETKITLVSDMVSLTYSKYKMSEINVAIVSCFAAMKPRAIALQ